MRLTLLNRFLQFLKLLESIGDFIAFLFSPVGLALWVCGSSYYLLLWGQCDPPTSAILASAIAMTAYSLVKQPNA